MTCSGVARRRLTGLVALVITSVVAAAEPEQPPATGDELIQTYLSRQALDIEAGFDPTTPVRDRERLLAEYLYMIGLAPMPERTPLHATITGTHDRGEYVVEKLHFQSRPGLYVTGNVYRPKDIPAGQRLPAVLYVCGHGYNGPEGVKVGYQSNGIWLARHGYIALLIDTLERGEIKSVHHGLYRERRPWWISRGYTPAGVECWNGIRAIDYLQSRPDVDPERIAVTGISGGGAVTIWIAVADTRVKVAVPVSGMADLQAYVCDHKVDRHCDCMFLHNCFRWPWAQIAAMIAPRPLLFANSDADPLFPMDANERVINRLERVYAQFGASADVDAVVSVGDHAYRQDLREAIFRFLNIHLKGDASPVKDTEIDLVTGTRDQRVFPIAPANLRVFAKGELPADERNSTADRWFVPMAEPALPQAGEFAAWKAALMKELRRVTFVTLPEEIAPARSVSGTSEYFTDGQGAAMRLLRRDAGEGEIRRVELIVRVDSPDAKTASEPAAGDDVASVAPTPGQAVYLCEPRGVGSTRWKVTHPPNRIEREHTLVGTTADTGRVHDVAAAAAWLREKHPDAHIHVTGSGTAGVIAAYAALWQPAIDSVTVEAPPASHMDPTAPQLLNVLRVCDIPDALGMLAPRRLTLIGGDAKLAERVAHIYAAAGAAEHLSR